MYGKKLLDYVIALGTSQSEIANHLGIHRTHVNRWIHGSRPVPEHYRYKLLGLIEKTFPRYCSRLETQSNLAGTSEERLKVWAEPMAFCNRLGKLIAEVQQENALENATRALEALKATPPGALLSRANALDIAECATALLTYVKPFAACAPLADLLKEVERDADLVRESSELGDVCQPSAIDQQADAEALADKKPGRLPGSLCGQSRASRFLR